MGNPLSLQCERRQSLLLREQGAYRPAGAQPASSFPRAPGGQPVLWGKVAPPQHRELLQELDGLGVILGNSQEQKLGDFTVSPS